MFLFNWYLKLMKLFASLVSRERSFQILQKKEEMTYIIVVFSKMVGVYLKHPANHNW